MIQYFQPSMIHNIFQVAHNFDINSLTDELHLTFYQQVKLVNYVRRQASVDIFIIIYWLNHWSMCNGI